MQNTDVHAVAHEASHGAEHAEHAAHELPNFITYLNQAFPDAGWAHFLHEWENVIFSSFAALIIVSTALIAAGRNDLIPRGLRNFWEVLAQGIAGFVEGIIGPKYAKEHIPFLGTLFIYILLQNWFGLIPLFKSPTSSWGTTIPLALITVVYVQWTGITKQGPLHYMKHIAGNPSNMIGWLLLPLMLLINISVEFAAVPLSLSLRLFANVSSEDRLLFKFAELNIMFKGVLFLFQLFANVMAVAFSIVQAFVFMLLTTVYISLVLPHDDHEHEEEGLLAADHAHSSTH
jgi:F-type H+-transporting ATPase subunit a